MEWLNEYHLGGVLIGICTFLVIGLFHPAVIKAEYYFGNRCRWWFVALGIISLVASIAANDILLQTLLGVFSFSSFWSVKEIADQHERVRKGWFPMNPKRKSDYELK